MENEIEMEQEDESATEVAEEQPEESEPESPKKRGRGRPKGSGKKTSQKASVKRSSAVRHAGRPRASRHTESDAEQRLNTAITRAQEQPFLSFGNFGNASSGLSGLAQGAETEEPGSVLSEPIVNSDKAFNGFSIGEPETKFSVKKIRKYEPAFGDMGLGF